jgi:hypothetical protein
VEVSVKRISDWPAPGSDFNPNPRYKRGKPKSRWSVLADQFRLLVRDLGDEWSYYASRPRVRVVRVSKADYPRIGDWPAELARSAALQRSVVGYLNDFASRESRWDASWAQALNDLTDDAGKQ